ncbi:MAG: hypothetical protein QOI46_2202, partial [Alphaproteobacteria bacterium]|nr:hypothetical protein [Alphaproteobacteria bacterium]
ALASFDGTALADIVAPGLTSLASPVQRIVASSLMLLESGSTRSVMLLPELVVRGSTAPELATFNPSGTGPK